jgi:hypothetical protein
MSKLKKDIQSIDKINLLKDIKKDIKLSDILKNNNIDSSNFYPFLKGTRKIPEEKADGIIKDIEKKLKINLEKVEEYNKKHQ